jgi:hypothetical protein
MLKKIEQSVDANLEHQQDLQVSGVCPRMRLMMVVKSKYAMEYDTALRVRILHNVLYVLGSCHLRSILS